MPPACPRILVAGTSGDSGKTVVTVGLVRAFARQGQPVTAFKKGPDYIDASWLAAASGKAARNLDTFLADPAAVRRSFEKHAVTDGINIIEGNRGLHDGLDVEGSHSSAALSKLIDCPVILVLDATKATRSTAAFVLGSQAMDKEVNIAGVILNRIAGARHEDIARRSIETHCGVPVVGAIPKLSDDHRIPARHLGLVTAVEQGGLEELIERLADAAAASIDLERVRAIAASAPAMKPSKVAGTADQAPDASRATTGGKRLRICYLSDAAFSFYYPENLEALEAEGAELIPLSALEARGLPDCDALYIGGGFPEVHATALSRNEAFRAGLLEAARNGLPIYAECGGLIYLAESLAWRGEEFPMAGIFPIRIEMFERPRGHGYAGIEVDGDNPFFAKGTKLKGHEFHYSRPAGLEGPSGLGAPGGPEEVKSVFDIERGAGCGHGRDGLSRWNALGTYLHVHALGCPAWAKGVIDAAERYRKD